MVGIELTDEEKAIILKWYKEGKLTCPRLIAQALNRHHQTIRRYLRSQGIRLPRYKPCLRRATVKDLSVAQAAYLAGLIDGEGSIGLNKNSLSWAEARVQLVIGNKDEALMRWLVENVGGRYYVRERSGINKSKLYVWMLTRIIDIVKVLKQTEPYLVLKKGLARNVMTFCEKRISDLYGSLALDLLINPAIGLKL